MSIIPMKKPALEVNMVKASKVFGIKNKELDFDVPVFVEKHEFVPDIDENYEFRAEILAPLLWAFVNNKKAWLSGHTGTGKSTLIKQICARLNWPLVRVNFDSEISRMDLIGRDTIKNGTSTFVDGVLPQALQGPYVLLCDEVDFIRPDVAYVFQRALEDEGLLISEDGGRVIVPHEWSRIVATGNTQGQGDEFGMYQGARAQSMAFLDRFTVWLSCDYLSREAEERLLRKLVPDVTDKRAKEVLDYVTEHRRAFMDGKIMQPVSPRTLVTFAQSVTFFDKLTNGEGFKKAAKFTLLNKANANDAAQMIGLLDRVEKPEPWIALKSLNLS